MSSQILLICGPTATGKTALAQKLAHQFNGELISADSRQVYRGLDIITGKDPVDVPLHLIDVANPDQTFSVSQWHDLAVSVIADVHSRGKLPIVVGGTGLYLKSLTLSLSQISIPPNPPLRYQLSSLSPGELFNKLNQLDADTASALNDSDRQNPRRLIRKIEIAQYIEKNSLPCQGEVAESRKGFNILSLSLTAPLPYLQSQIANRVRLRISAGAKQEAEQFVKTHPLSSQAATACGIPALLSNAPEANWIASEVAYAKRQLTWFKKQPRLHWLDVSQPDFVLSALSLVQNWYNSPNG